MRWMLGWRSGAEDAKDVKDVNESQGRPIGNPLAALLDIIENNIEKRLDAQSLTDLPIVRKYDRQQVIGQIVARKTA